MKNDLSQVRELLEAAQPKAEDVTEEEQEAEGVEVESVAEEVEGEEETEESEEEQEDVTGSETSESYTMKSLAAAIELEQSELYDVLIPMGGGAEPVSIGSMKNQFQDMVREKAGFETKIQELEQAQTQAPQQAQVSQAEFDAQVEMKRVQDEYNATDWKDLDEYDPGKSALLRQQFNDRYNQAQGIMNQAGQYRQQEHATFLQEQQVKLLEVIPAWTDTTVRSADEAKIRSIMLDAGYTDDIIRGNTDPISLKLLHELMTLRAEKEQSTEMVKKVKKAPKAIKGQRIAPVTKAETVHKLISKAKKTRNKHDAEDAVKALFRAAQAKS